MAKVDLTSEANVERIKVARGLRELWLRRTGIHSSATYDFFLLDDEDVDVHYLLLKGGEVVDAAAHRCDERLRQFAEKRRAFVSTFSGYLGLDLEGTEHVLKALEADDETVISFALDWRPSS